MSLQDSHSSCLWKICQSYLYLVITSVLLAVTKCKQMVRYLSRFLSTLSVLRDCFLVLVQWVSLVPEPLLCNFKHFLLSNSAQCFATLCCPHVRRDFNDCLFFPCSLYSFPSSFHIFGCDPAEPSDSLLLNATAHQSTPGFSNSSMLLPGINKSRRGAFLTSPVLQADIISNLASQQCLMSPCFFLCCRHPRPLSHSLRLPSFEAFQEFIICSSIFDQAIS